MRGIEYIATNLNVLMPISLQHNGVDLRYLKLRLVDLTKLKPKVFDITLQKYKEYKE